MPGRGLAGNPGRLPDGVSRDDGPGPGIRDGGAGIPRTRQLKIIGNGVVPQQAALALRLLIGAAAIPAPLADRTRAAA